MLASVASMDGSPLSNSFITLSMILSRRSSSVATCRVPCPSGGLSFCKNSLSIARSYTGFIKTCPRSHIAYWGADAPILAAN